MDNNTKIEKIMDKNVEELKKMLVVHPNDQKYVDWRYSNLRITRLERVFFTLLSKHLKKDNRTKLFRDIIKKLMRKYPEVVEEAKKFIDDGLDEGDD
jgi:hypothetical protein